jgi:phosphonate transport system substrate-binding protein
LRKRWTGLLLLLAGLGTAVAGDTAAPLHGSDRGELVLGRISDDPKAHYEQLKPLLDYVVPRMADVGITSGRILMARDAQQMGSYLRRGQVDWFTETAGTAMLLQQRAGARLLLLTERNGVSRYHSMILVRRNSGIGSLSDLRGRRIAFERTTSTSGYLVPAAALLNAGLPLEGLLSPRDKPSPRAVGYLFAGSETNVATWVHKGLADAGAVSNLDWDDAGRLPDVFRADMRVIHQTADIPRAVEMVRGSLDARVAQRLRTVLLQAASDPEAGPALRQFFGTTRFLPVDAAAQRALARLGAGSARVREALE